MHPSRWSAANLDHSFLAATWVIAAVRPLNRITEDGDLTDGNPRDPIPVLTRCVLGRNDVHS